MITSVAQSTTAQSLGALVKSARDIMRKGKEITPQKPAIPSGESPTGVDGLPALPLQEICVKH